MRKRSTLAAVAAGTAMALVLAACGGDDDGGGNDSSPGTTTPKQNAGIGQVFNPSDTKGGTLRIADSGEPDSTDPADMYYGYAWDFVRLYGRALTMFAPKPGDAGLELIPDLAESLGEPSDDLKTWTYTLKEGLKFDDGTPITSKDVKYAVERSLDKDTFPNGPTYFNDYLDLQGYTSPYSDPSPDKLGLEAIETPDDQTIIFHLETGFSGFDYFAMLPSTIPVPQAKDTGTKYKEHPVSSGPYMFDSYESGKQFTLVRNPNWDPETDPNRAALPDRIEYAMNVDATDIDNRLIAGELDINAPGTGVQPAAQGRILADPNLIKNTDEAVAARTWWTAINSDVPPFDNIDCRKAVILATDHEGYQRAYGGETGGEIATSLLPPQIPGAQKIDPYDFAGNPNGDVDAAKQALADCGQPDGFSTNLSFRVERPKEQATAESLQQALAKVGINLTLKPYPQGDYFKLYAGNPAYAKENGLGLMVFGWGADWPDGYGFLAQVTDSRVIREAGNTNLGIKVPAIDQMLDEALATTDVPERNKIWGEIDKTVMENALVIPGIWAKALLYRPPNLTNVYVNDGLGGYYDYAWVGVEK